MTSTATIRPVRLDDVPAVVTMVYGLADFEQSSRQCHLLVIVR